MPFTANIFSAQQQPNSRFQNDREDLENALGMSVESYANIVIGGFNKAVEYRDINYMVCILNCIFFGEIDDTIIIILKCLTLDWNVRTTY